LHAEVQSGGVDFGGVALAVVDEAPLSTVTNPGTRGGEQMTALLVVLVIVAVLVLAAVFLVQRRRRSGGVIAAPPQQSAGDAARDRPTGPQ
jgi:LPXTG-motif cell wall-anchored protein